MNTGQAARPPLNEKLIQCVLDHIENQPDEYDQNVWAIINGDEKDEYCGTVGCFAGWACMLTTPTSQWKYLGNWENIAAEKLGLARDEHYLFGGVDGANSKAAVIGVIKNRLNRIRRERGLPEVDYAAVAAAKGATAAKTKGDGHEHDATATE